MSMETPYDSINETLLNNSGLIQDIVSLETRLDDLETEFDRLTDRDRSHIRAKAQDARETVQRGERYEIVVITPPEENNGTHAITKIDGLYTFVDAGSNDFGRGDLVEIRIVDVGDSHAEAVALTVLDSEGADG